MDSSSPQYFCPKFPKLTCPSTTLRNVNMLLYFSKRLAKVCKPSFQSVLLNRERCALFRKKTHLAFSLTEKTWKGT